MSQSKALQWIRRFLRSLRGHWDKFLIRRDPVAKEFKARVIALEEVVERRERDRAEAIDRKVKEEEEDTDTNTQF